MAEPEQTPAPATPVPNGGAPEAPPETPSFGNDWRETWAGQDEGRLTYAKRYDTPQAMFDAAFNANQVISKGQHKVGTPPDTPAELTAWRKERGIPDKPEGYLEKLPQGLVIGEQDKPIIGQFLEQFHAENIQPKTAHKLIQSYYALQDKQAGELKVADEQQGAERVAALKAAWGPDYQVTANAVRDFLQTAPPEVDTLLSTARVGDGTPYGGKLMINEPVFAQWLGQLAREYSPVHPVVGGGDAGGKGVNERIAEIEKYMADRSRNSPYWYGAQSEPMQAELRLLYEKREKIAKR